MTLSVPYRLTRFSLVARCRESSPLEPVTHYRADVKSDDYGVYRFSAGSVHSDVSRHETERC